MGFPDLERPRRHEGFGHPSHCQANIQNAASAEGPEPDRSDQLFGEDEARRRLIKGVDMPAAPELKPAFEKIEGELVSTPGQRKSRPSSGSVSVMECRVG
jgi:hypothetical protein